MGTGDGGLQFDKVDLAYAHLIGADLRGARTRHPELPTSLFLADLKQADLRGSSWVDDEEHRNPPLSAWLDQQLAGKPVGW